MDLKSTFIIGLAGCLFLTVGCASKLSRVNSNNSKLSNLVDDSNEMKTEMRFGMARLAERNERQDEAYKAYLEIVNANPSHVESLHRLGILAARRGQFDQSTEFFDRAVSVGDPSAELLGDIGYAKYLANDFETAADVLRNAIFKAPNNKRNSNNLALVLGMQKRYRESLDQFRQSSSEAESIASLAFVQSQTGQAVDAQASYHRALEVDSSLDIAANGLVELDKFNLNQPLATVAGQEPNVASVATVMDGSRRSTRFEGAVGVSPAQESNHSPKLIAAVEPVIANPSLESESDLGVSEPAEQPSSVKRTPELVIAPVAPISNRRSTSPIQNSLNPLAVAQPGILSNEPEVVSDELGFVSKETRQETREAGLVEQMQRARSGNTDQDINSEPGFIANSVSKNTEPAKAPSIQAAKLVAKADKLASQPTMESRYDGAVRQVSYEFPAMEPQAVSDPADFQITDLPSQESETVVQQGILARIVLPAKIGSQAEAQFSIELTNNTGVQAKNVLVELEVPAGIRLTVLDRKSWTNKTATMFRWRIPVIEPGKVETIRYRGIADSVGAYSQKAKVFFGGKECNSAQATLQVLDSTDN